MDIKNRFKIATVQLNSRLGDVKTNLTRAIDYIDQAVSLGAEIILFPELYLQGYCADQDLTKTSETIPGPTTDVLLGVSKKYNVYIVMGMARKDTGYPHLVYNSSCFIGPNGMVGYYDKIHLGTFHPYREGMYFAPGNLTPVFNTRMGPMSLQICYDVFFPELTRTYAIKGSLVNLVISAGPDAFRDSWRVMLQARAIENAFPTVYCNVVGKQKDFNFFGGSMIVSASGAVTSEAKFGEEDMLVSDVDLVEAINIRRQTLLYRDRRPDLYGPLSAAIGSPPPSQITTT